MTRVRLTREHGFAKQQVGDNNSVLENIRPLAPDLVIRLLWAHISRCAGKLLALVLADQPSRLAHIKITQLHFALKSHNDAAPSSRPEIPLLIRPSAISSNTSSFKLPTISDRVAINTISNHQKTVSGTANAKEQNIV